MMRGNRLGEQTSSIAINRTTSGSAESVRARVCVTIGCSHSLIVLQTNTLNYQPPHSTTQPPPVPCAMWHIKHAIGMVHTYQSELRRAQLIKKSSFDTTNSGRLLDLGLCTPSLAACEPNKLVRLRAAPAMIQERRWVVATSGAVRCVGCCVVVLCCCGVVVKGSRSKEVGPKLP
jgi:hypothetical protein